MVNIETEKSLLYHVSCISASEFNVYMDSVTCVTMTHKIANERA